MKALNAFNKIPRDKLLLSQEHLHYSINNSHYPYPFIQEDPITQDVITDAVKKYEEIRKKDYTGVSFPRYAKNMIVYSNQKLSRLESTAVTSALTVDLSRFWMWIEKAELALPILLVPSKYILSDSRTSQVLQLLIA